MITSTNAAGQHTCACDCRALDVRVISGGAQRSGATSATTSHALPPARHTSEETALDVCIASDVYIAVAQSELLSESEKKKHVLPLLRHEHGILTKPPLLN